MALALGSRSLASSRQQGPLRAAPCLIAARPVRSSPVSFPRNVPITITPVVGLLDPNMGMCSQARTQQNAQRCRALPSSYPIVRELPTKVAETFYVVQDPALFNTSYSDALLVRVFVGAVLLGQLSPIGQGSILQHPQSLHMCGCFFFGLMPAHARPWSLAPV